MTGSQLVAAMLAAVGYWMAGRPGMALGFAGYIAANLGLIFDAIKHGG